jgi:hypothetical protein
VPSVDEHKFIAMFNLSELLNKLGIRQALSARMSPDGENHYYFFAGRKLP